MTDDEKNTLRAKIMSAFKPSAPIDRMQLFAGRQEQSDRVINAVLQQGQHAILYGERGVGKTSLAKVLNEILSKAGVKTVNSETINCDATDDFSSLWHKAFRELSFKIKVASAHFDKSENEREINLDALVPKKITPDDARRALSTISPTSSVIVFDEFDRITNRETKTLMADTIKNLSDHGVDTTLLIVGVAESVVELIAEHQSIERAVVEVRMPRMSMDELNQVITRGYGRAGMRILESVRDKIIRLSNGLPHYTHLLSLESGLAAIDNNKQVVEDGDFITAVNRIVKNKQSVSHAYYNAVSSQHKSSKHKLTLLACALSPIDDKGYFQASAVAGTMSQLLQRECSVSDIQKHLTEFVSEKRGSVLQREGTLRRFRYRFSNPLMQPYTVIYSLSDKLISESQLWIMEQPTYK